MDESAVNILYALCMYPPLLNNMPLVVYRLLYHTPGASILQINAVLPQRLLVVSLFRCPSGKIMVTMVTNYGGKKIQEQKRLLHD